MKQLLFLFFFIISFGMQIAYAATIGTPEIIILIVLGCIAIAAMIGFVFLCLYLIKKIKRVENEK